jgi:general secretion pathway protein C
METLLKRHFWVLNLLGLGILAWLAAGALSAFAGVQLSQALRGNDKSQLAAAEGESLLDKRLRDGRLREESGAVMSGMSLFLIQEPEPEPEPEEDPLENTDEAAATQGEPEPTFEPTTLPIKLLGTMVVQPASWSSATVEVEKANNTVVSVGAELLGGQAKVYAIRRNLIVLQESDKLTIARLTQPDAGGAGPGADGQPVPPGGGLRPPPAGGMPPRTTEATPNNEPKSGGVQKVAEGAYTMDRAHVNEKLKDVSALSREARVVPNYKNGKYEGFRMIGMQDTGLFREIGFENGDVVQAVNGERIDSPNKALALYDALKNKSRLTVLVERGGVLRTMRYTVK